MREERKRLGWSQANAASAAGVSREMWSKYESGAEPGARVLAAIAGAGADVNYILTGSKEHSPQVTLTAEEALLLEYFREASKDVRRAALGALFGASAPGQIGGTHSQHNSGMGAIQIGSIGESPIKRRR
nr:helix-turn-helix transcriptional regulator [Acidovorax sp. SUPP3334]